MTRSAEADRARVMAAKQSADLLEILGISQQKRAAGTHAGEWGCSCIWCGGDDRFRVWPNHPEGPRAWCRQCERGGDAIDIIRELHQLDFPEALAYLEGGSGSVTPASPSAYVITRATRAAEDREREDREAIAAARATWDGTESARDTLAATYLRARGIEIPIPLAMRYAPALRHPFDKTEHPALVGGVTEADGSTLIGVMRIYVRADGTGKADTEQPKLMQGRPGGGAVHLAPAGPVLAVSEGIETGLSFLQLSGLPVWAALSTTGITRLILPPLPLAAEVVVAADFDTKDPHKNPGMEAAKKAAKIWTSEGRTVQIVPPLDGHNDWNDVLMEAAK
jgi:phage/plasmid primase-like uncharacterized protein